jgi:voltage-gated sodium channel
MILVVIIINTLTLVLKWPYMNERLQLFVEIVNDICTGVFILEAIFKIIAFGRSYFKESWNIFDLIIVIGSLVFISPNFKR